jgi:hypothetical protein
MVGKKININDTKVRIKENLILTIIICICLLNIIWISFLYGRREREEILAVAYIYTI